MSWPTSVGFMYQVEYKDDLNLISWTPLGPTLPGTGSSITITNEILPSGQRFYRLRLVP
jgi:hypothetical protein